jgi:hypothetical protein
MTSDPGDELTLQEMADRFRIQDLLYREARAIDTRDWSLWRTCYTEDADIDWRGNDAIRARRDEAGEWLSKVSENFPAPAYQHFCANIEIDLEGDHARTRTLQLIPISLPLRGRGTADGLLRHLVRGRDRAGRPPLEDRPSSGTPGLAAQLP